MAEREKQNQVVTTGEGQAPSQNPLQSVQDSKIIEELVLHGNLNRLSSAQRVEYNNALCQSLGLNALTQPFRIIEFTQGQNKVATLYATKACTDQLRKINGISVYDLKTEIKQTHIICTALGIDRNEVKDTGIGVVPLSKYDKFKKQWMKLNPDEYANAIMKAETKAKRRLTLALSGLGIIDDTERETIPGATTRDVDAQLVDDSQTEKPEGWDKPEQQEKTKPEETRTATLITIPQEEIAVNIQIIDRLKEVMNISDKTLTKFEEASGTDNTPAFESRIKKWIVQEVARLSAKGKIDQAKWEGMLADLQMQEEQLWKLSALDIIEALELLKLKGV